MSTFIPQHFFIMSLIFSDYAAEIGNVPGVTRPALIDLCVRQAKFRHAFITAEEFCSFLGWSVEEEKCHSSSFPFAGSLHRDRVPAQERRGPKLHGCCSSLPRSPFSLVYSPPSLWSECQKPPYWRPPPSLWTDLKPHFHFVLGMAFSVSRLCSLLTTKNISEGWKHGNKIIFSFFIRSK